MSNLNLWLLSGEKSNHGSTRILATIKQFGSLLKGARSGADSRLVGFPGFRDSLPSDAVTTTAAHFAKF